MVALSERLNIKLLKKKKKILKLFIKMDATDEFPDCVLLMLSTTKEHCIDGL